MHGKPRHARSHGLPVLPAALAAVTMGVVSMAPAPGTGEFPAARESTGPQPQRDVSGPLASLRGYRAQGRPVSRSPRPPGPWPARQPPAEVSPVTATLVSAPDTSLASQVAGYARRFAGVPYLRGGTTPAGWDCSGFAQFAYAHFGLAVPRDSEEQYAAATLVSQEYAVPGDRVFFLAGTSAYHVGIYLGNGEMVSALNEHYGTIVTPVSWGGAVYAFGQVP